MAEPFFITIENEKKPVLKTSPRKKVVEDSAPAATSTPLRTSPRKKVAEEGKPKEVVEENKTKEVETPRRTSPRKKVSTPYTPGRAQEVKIAGLRVEINILKDDMEKAVRSQDFLKAHTVSESIKKLEEEVKKMQEDTSYVSQLVEVEKKKEEPAAAAPDPKTPKTPRNVSVVSTPGSKTKVTPSAKQSKKELLEQERQAKKEALEKEKQAKKEALEKEKQIKKEAKEKERIEKEKQKEAEKKAKEEERLEKERLKKIEKEKADAEKMKVKQEKEEEKQRKKAEKEAEAKQKEEEKKYQEEAEKEKAKKEAQAFTSFFKKVEPKEVKEAVAEESVEGFTPFRVKKNMRLAPLVRGDTDLAKQSIDALDMPCGPDHLYLSLLKSVGYTPGRQGKTWPYEKLEDKDEVEVLEDEEADDESDPEDDLDETNVNIIMRKNTDKTVKIPRAKLLKFHENRRPAYWGTWTKKSRHISGRKPFGRDDDLFEYDYDSDDDWEEEEEGESLSDDEKDKEEDAEENDDYEVDNEFFVPHGYLSDEEEDREEDEVMDPETAKQKQKLAAKEFEKEHKKKTQELKPRLWGTYWLGEETLNTEAAAVQLTKILGGFTGIVCGDNNNPIDTGFTKTFSSPSTNQNHDDITDSVKTNKGVKARSVPDEALPDLIRLVHGNFNNKVFLAKEFMIFWSKKHGGESPGEEGATPTTKSGFISKKKMIDKITEIAEYKKNPEGVGRCWCVKDELLEKHPVSGQEWSYNLEQPNKTSNNDDISSRPESPACKTSQSPAPANLITKFAR